MSNGAYFAARLGCDAPDVFAAVAAFAGGNPETAGNPCKPSEPVAVAQMHGSSDTVVPLALGRKARDAVDQAVVVQHAPDLRARPVRAARALPLVHGGLSR